MKNTKIISAFPGCGKTYCFNKYKDSDIKILDSDSSEFSWIKDDKGNNTKERNPEFPENYINHIKANIGKVDIIFVSSHDVVRRALKDNDLNYYMIYPDINCKEEYITRYRNRGNDEKFISFIDKNFNSFIEDISKEEFPHKITLLSNETIDDVIKYGYCGNMVSHMAWNCHGCPITCSGCDFRNHIVE